MEPEVHTLAAAAGGYRRKVWHLPAESVPRRFAIFLDGEHYVERMDAPEVVRSLTRRGAIPPTNCLFVSNQDGAARHRDFTCNDGYRRFIVDDLVPWMRRHGGPAEGGDHLIAGTSLSGLQAAFTAVSHPRIFSRVLCQSGSFWWNGEWLKNHLPAGDDRCRFWLSAGTRERGAGLVHPPTAMHQEIDQDVAVTRFAEAAGRRSHRICHHLYEGGHEVGNWKEELPEALRWLLE